MPTAAEFTTGDGTDDSGASSFDNDGQTSPASRAASPRSIQPTLEGELDDDEEWLPAGNQKRKQPPRRIKPYQRIKAGDDDDDSCPVDVWLPDMEDRLAGTEFDPDADTEILKSGILGKDKNAAKDIRPVRACIARARWECRNNRQSLLRTCHWIKAFHENKSDKANSTWANNKMVRRLKGRLMAALREMHLEGVAKQGMPEPEDIIAFRLCSPHGEFNSTIGGLLFELGYLHYGSPVQCSNTTPYNFLALGSHGSALETTSGVDKSAFVTEDLLLAIANTIKSSHNDLKRVVAAHYEEHSEALEGVTGRIEQGDAKTTELERQCTSAKESIDKVATTAKNATEASSAAAVDAAKAWAMVLELSKRVAELEAKLERGHVTTNNDTVTTRPEADPVRATTTIGQAYFTPIENAAHTHRSATPQPATASESRMRNVDEAPASEGSAPKRVQVAGAGTRASAHTTTGKRRASTTTRAAAGQRKSVMENWTME